ncbi:hypothetical protein Tco_1022161 [Tanacetum coccineum]
MTMPLTMQERQVDSIFSHGIYDVDCTLLFFIGVVHIAGEIFRPRSWCKKDHTNKSQRLRLLALWWGKLAKLASTVDAFCAFDCLLIRALHIKKKLNAKAMVVCGTPQLSLKSVDPVSWWGSHAWIMVAAMTGDEIGPYLGEAARHRACSHGQLHTFFSCPILINLSPTLKLLRNYVVLLRIVEGWQSARIGRLSNLYERRCNICETIGLLAFYLAVMIFRLCRVAANSGRMAECENCSPQQPT